MFKRVEGLHDHRLLALVTALIVEDRIDKLLATFCPRYELLSEQTEFTFSLRIRMLEALSLIPRSLTDAAHIIRVVRNDFAHNLERTCLDDVEKKILRRMEALVRRISPSAASPTASREGNFKNFKFVSFVAIVSLELYEVNLENLRNKISEPAFVASLQSQVKEQFEKIMHESRSRGPKYVKRNGDKWEIGYEKFSEIVDQLPPGMEPPKN